MLQTSDNALLILPDVPPRGGDILETTSHVNTIVFDKTGTLTVGRPLVTRVAPLQPDMNQQDVLMLAAAVERQTTHPIARAIVSAADSQGEETWRQTRMALALASGRVPANAMLRSTHVALGSSAALAHFVTGPCHCRTHALRRCIE